MRTTYPGLPSYLCDVTTRRLSEVGTVTPTPPVDLSFPRPPPPQCFCPGILHALAARIPARIRFADEAAPAILPDAAAAAAGYPGDSLKKGEDAPLPSGFLVPDNRPTVSVDGAGPHMGRREGFHLLCGW